MTKRKNIIIKTEEEINDELILNIISMCDNFDYDREILEMELSQFKSDYSSSVERHFSEEVALMDKILLVEEQAEMEVEQSLEFEEVVETSDDSDLIFDFLNSFH